MPTTTAQGLARDAAQSFEVATRDDGTTYTRRTSDAPEWLEDLCRDAHGEMFPDDWRYACIAAACEAIADASDPEDEGHDFADSYVDVYTSDLYEWLASSGYRQGYVDDASEEYGSASGLVEMISLGQYSEALEVYGLVLAYLERIAA